MIATKKELYREIQHLQNKLNAMSEHNERVITELKADVKGLRSFIRETANSFNRNVSFL